VGFPQDRGSEGVAFDNAALGNPLDSPKTYPTNWRLAVDCSGFHCVYWIATKHDPAKLELIMRVLGGDL
jgi:hypothetical protein